MLTLAHAHYKGVEPSKYFLEHESSKRKLPVLHVKSTSSKMATSTNPRHSTEIRTQFSTKEGVYRNAKASEHCRPSRQPLFGKELSPVQISLVSCKAQDGVYEWIAFNSGKELYFYRFDGVGKVSKCHN